MIQIAELVVLLVIAFEDMKSMSVSSWKVGLLAVISIVGAVFGIVMGSCDIQYAAVALLPGVVLIVLYYVSGKQIGLGDGLVTLCMGPAFGLENVVLGMVTAFFASGLFSIVMIAVLKSKGKKRYPFIPFIAAGMAVAEIAKI
ncbi:MAG: prepilin peptidase [Butyrivibrio sp.]|nr:prepilin peptidase [Butyrivibrio sp.]